jgi:SlyX protein
MTALPTDTLEEINQRLTALEIKASFSEDLLDKLDQIVIRQQTQINALISEVLHLRQQAAEPQAQGKQGAIESADLADSAYLLFGICHMLVQRVDANLESRAKAGFKAQAGDVIQRQRQGRSPCRAINQRMKMGRR